MCKEKESSLSETHPLVEHDKCRFRSAVLHDSIRRIVSHTLGCRTHTDLPIGSPSRLLNNIIPIFAVLPNSLVEACPVCLTREMAIARGVSASFRFFSRLTASMLWLQTLGLMLRDKIFEPACFGNPYCALGRRTCESAQ